ncbi:unnamed protein product [Phyllotreta striolata]|uniref:Sulfatase N-terminal domain-containing protein n=1 Tax=Phyllotreta striolata TaxID=444603 RepID=A0A9N9XU22_PHYSR|nr:unnamed protein product [Phyllotreta striolata]
MKVSETLLICLICFQTTISKHPNVLFIIADDLRPSLGCYGSKEAHTPNIDSLATKSFLFKNAFAQQALCGPSRTSFLTSRRPDSLRTYDNWGNYWRASLGNFVTLPQHFKRNGYYAYSIGKVFHPGRLSNHTDDYPYSWSVEAFHPPTEKYSNAKVCSDKKGGLARNLICPVVPEYQPSGTLPDLESSQEAERFLRNWRGITDGRPFFLAVGFHKPHVPFKFPVEYLDFHPLENVSLPTNRWRPAGMPEVAWNPWNDVRKRDDIDKLKIPYPYGPMADETMREIKRAYYASVSYIDDMIGRILKHVDEETVVVLTGDHGWSIGEHGEFAKYSNFDIATKVPLLIHVPRLSNTEIIFNNPVELVDIFPTLVDLTQISQPLKKCAGDGAVLCTEGRSLVQSMVKILRNTKIASSSAFSQYPRPGLVPSRHPDSDQPKSKEIEIMGYSIRTKRYRYTEWVEFSTKSFRPDWNVTFGRELYDHLIDIQENDNIVDREAMGEIVRTLREKLMLGWRYI